MRTVFSGFACSRCFSSATCARLLGGELLVGRDPEYVVLEHVVEVVDPQDQIQGLIPRHVAQLDGHRAADPGIDDDVELGEGGEGLEHVADIGVFEAQADRLTGELLLLGLDLGGCVGLGPSVGALRTWAAGACSIICDESATKGLRSRAPVPLRPPIRTRLELGSDQVSASLALTAGPGDRRASTKLRTSASGGSGFGVCGVGCFETVSGLDLVASHHILGLGDDLALGDHIGQRLRQGRIGIGHPDNGPVGGLCEVVPNLALEIDDDPRHRFGHRSGSGPPAPGGPDPIPPGRCSG